MGYLVAQGATGLEFSHCVRVANCRGEEPFGVEIKLKDLGSYSALKMTLFARRNAVTKPITDNCPTLAWGNVKYSCAH